MMSGSMVDETNDLTDVDENSEQESYNSDSDSVASLDLAEVENVLPGYANQLLDRYSNWRRSRDKLKVNDQCEQKVDLSSELSLEQKLGLRCYQLSLLRKKQKHMKDQLLEYRRLVEIYEVIKLDNDTKEKKLIEQDEEVNDLENEVSCLRHRSVFQEYTEERNIELKDEVDRIRFSLEESKAKEDCHKNELGQLRQRMEDEIPGDSRALCDKRTCNVELKPDVDSMDKNEGSSIRRNQLERELSQLSTKSMTQLDLEEFIALKIKLAETQAENDANLGRLRRTKSELQPVLEENVVLKRTISINCNNVLFESNVKIASNCNNTKFLGLIPRNVFNEPQEHVPSCQNVDLRSGIEDEYMTTKTTPPAKKPSFANMMQNWKESSQTQLQSFMNLENPFLQSKDNLIKSKSSLDMSNCQNAKWGLVLPATRTNTPTTVSSNSLHKFPSNNSSAGISFTSLFSLRSLSKQQIAKQELSPLQQNLHNSEWHNSKESRKPVRNDNYSYLYRNFDIPNNSKTTQQLYHSRNASGFAFEKAGLSFDKTACKIQTTQTNLCRAGAQRSSFFD